MKSSQQEGKPNLKMRESFLENLQIFRKWRETRVKIPSGMKKVRYRNTFK